MATAAEMLIEEEPGCEAGMLAVMKPPANLRIEPGTGNCEAAIAQSTIKQNLCQNISIFHLAIPAVGIMAPEMPFLGRG
jgi:hypothetical protein